ncbi:MAG: polymerase sigma factor [Schlesneria sp.]|nr:polymerase sigma factor [Schlesneria sp.]
MIPQDEACTTAAVQRHLADLAGAGGESAVDQILRDLLARAVGRLQLLCGTLLFRQYPRLTQPPLNLQTDELLSSVVERLLKLLRDIHPTNVRQFFALANQHMRWELNDLARRLDAQNAVLIGNAELIPSPESSGSLPTENLVRILMAIEALPDEQREVFNLVRIQGMTHGEAAEILEVSEKTIQRKLAAGLLRLSQQLGNLRPDFQERVAQPSS